MKRKITKHILAAVICVAFALNLIQPVQAQESIAEIEYLSDGSYYLTEIQEDSVPSIGLLAATKTKTASRTTKYCSARQELPLTLHHTFFSVERHPIFQDITVSLLAQQFLILPVFNLP